MERPTSYTDAAGTARHVHFDVATFERLQQKLGIDLLGQSDRDAVSALSANALTLVKVLHCVVAPQEEWAAFARQHVGDVVEAAEAALTEAYIRFFPERRRAALRSLRAKHEAAIERFLTALESAVEGGALDAQLERDVQTAIQSLTGSTSGSTSTERPAS